MSSVPNDPNLQAELDAMLGKVTNTKGVLQSAKTYVEGNAERLRAAVEAAQALGADLSELAPIVAEINAADALAGEVAAAIAANP